MRRSFSQAIEVDFCSLHALETYALSGQTFPACKWILKTDDGLAHYCGNACLAARRSVPVRNPLPSFPPWPDRGLAAFRLPPPGRRYHPRCTVCRNMDKPSEKEQLRYATDLTVYYRSRPSELWRGDFVIAKSAYLADKGIDDKGLYTSQFIAEGAIIGEYTGTIISAEEANERNEGNPYLFNLIDGRVIDGMTSLGGFLCKINTVADRRRKESMAVLNVEWIERQGRIYAQAKRDIQEDEELLCWYGEHTRKIINTPRLPIVIDLCHD